MLEATHKRLTELHAQRIALMSMPPSDERRSSYTRLNEEYLIVQEELQALREMRRLPWWANNSK
jgi:hypothetical protein